MHALLREAYSSPDVEAVMAHTLPERNASVRVLEKCGFEAEGEAGGGEHAVWRFRHRRAAG